MKRIGYLSLFSIVFFSCKPKNNLVAESGETPGITSQTLIGSFTGPFGDNKITVLITKIQGDSVEGRSIVGGNDRPFTGSVKKDNETTTVIAREPGNEKHDGTFSFTFKPASPNTLTGQWTAFNTALGSKAFSLTRKSFSYKKGVGDYPEASQRELTEDDVNNLTKDELELMRNEIFARHGYCFKKKEIRDFFEDKDWYIPNTTSVAADLTTVERKNIALIRKYESYSKEYGDEFGR